MFLKKQILPIFCLALALASCKKEEPTTPNNGISINANDLRNVYAPNKGLTYGYLDKTKISVPTEGADQTWDYRNAKSSATPYSRAYKEVPANSGVSSATYIEERTANLGAVSFANAQDFYEVSESGWFSLGTKVPAQTLNLPNNVTLASTGTIYPYTPKLLLHKLPLAYQDNYSTTTVANEVFMLTAPALGLTTATPATRKVAVEQSSSVTGWGKVYLPDAAEPIEVLQVKVTSKQTTNYFLGTSPAPTALLSGLGLTDGAVSTLTYYVFLSKTLGKVAEVDYNVANVTSGVYRK